MSVHRDIMVLIVITVFISAGCVFGLPYIINVQSLLTPQEKKFSQFSYEKPRMIERVSSEMTNIRIQSPIWENKDELKGFPPEALADVMPAKSEDAGPKLSIVLIKDGEKLAMIDGIVVKEGDKAGDARVQKISKDGVMLRGKGGEKWLKLE